MPFMTTRLRLAVFVCATLAVGLSLSSGADRRPMTETDFLRFVWIADPQISPDGSQVIFTRVTVNEKDDGYETALWLAPADGSRPPRQFTTGPKDGGARWSPDGRAVAFLRPGSDPKNPVPQIYVISLAGGEARPITSLAKGAGSPRWSPDGKTLAFASSTPPKDADTATKPAGDAKAADADKKKSDVRVITRAVYRFNGAGYLDPTDHSHIWTVALPGPADAPADPHQVTSGDFSEDNIAWSPDGSRIYFTSTRILEPYYEQGTTELYSVPAAGGEATKVLSFDGGFGSYRFSPDGRSIAFVGSANHHPERSYDQPDLFVAPNQPGAAARNLTAAYDFDIGGGIGSDQHAPRGGQPGDPVWSSDGTSILVLTAEHGRADLVRVDVSSGAVTKLTEGDHEIESYAAAANGASLVALVSTTTEIGDLFTLNAGGARPAAMTPITNVNQTLFDTLNLTPPEEIWYTSFDGRKIQGWIQKPPSFDATKKYPLILEIHGGPHGAYGDSFFHEIQWMAAKGYVVLYVNPRGSTSYGQDFGNVIQYHYPGDDYRDLMAGVDAVVARGYVDAAHMGVTGGSGGGLLTNWVVTQTDRFAAAVSQRSIADWAGFWYTADFPLFTRFWFHGAPWEDPKDFADRSPITYVGRVKTPLMLIVGDADMRTPEADGGEQMFRALKYLKVPTVMVQFPGETHELSRSGKPAHRVERLQHIVAWFDKYLQGKAIDTYQVK